MKHLYYTLRDSLLSTFDENNPYLRLYEVLVQNNQLFDMENTIQHNFPSVYYEYAPVTWTNLLNKTRYATVQFDLVVAIESYDMIEDSFRLEDYVVLIKDHIDTINFNNQRYYISKPWVTSEQKNFNNTNIMTYTITFNTNVTECYGNLLREYIDDVSVSTSITNLDEATWILSNGIWNDNLNWDDTETWQDN